MSGMISEAELINLPEDPELAFVYFEHLARARLEDALSSAHHEACTLQFELDYMSDVLGAAVALNVDELKNWELPNVNDSEVANICRQFKNLAKHIAIQLHIKHARRLKQYSVAFNPATKAKLRHHLGQIRDTVDKLEVSNAKKEALYSKIEALQLEIDKERTRFESLAALLVEVADTAGEAAEKFEPVKRLIEIITGTFGKSKRTEDEQARLPAPRGLKRIEPPKKPLNGKEQKRSLGKEDEIPF